MRRARGTGLVLLGVAVAAAGAATAAPRIHRTTLPPPVPLPTQLSVDETEWSVRPSKRVVAAGEVRLQVYNRGMDDHDLAIVDADGTRHRLELGPRASGELVVNLPAGRHKIWCSLFEGSAASHEQLGMVAYVDARPQVVVPATTAERRHSARIRSR